MGPEFPNVNLTRTHARIAVARRGNVSRVRKFVPWFSAAVFLLFAFGCHKASSDDEAIRSAIREHLEKSGTLNLAGMDTEFQQITVNGDHAQAQVLFRAKQEGSTMQMTYALERQNGEWTVLKSIPAGGQIAHPPTDGSHAAPGDASGSELPHLHPPTPATPQPGKPQ